MGMPKEEIKIIIDGQEFTAPLRKFKNGEKEGYGVYGRVKIDDYPYQISCNIIRL